MPFPSSVLESKLRRLDGKSYKSYQELEGEYDFGLFLLYIDWVQSDPFAPPSRLRVRVSQRKAGFPPELFRNYIRRVALADFITRGFAFSIRKNVKGPCGTGKSGLLFVDEGGQEVLERTSCVINQDFVEVRFRLGLPARGRRCLGHQAQILLLEKIPQIVSSSLFYSAYEPSAVRQHVMTVEDQEELRRELPKSRLVAFVANDSILPRASGVSDRPLPGKKVVKFVSPPELEVELLTPNRGKIRGMGIPEGVTLIVGGGYHGKSTLLSALARSVYNHIPGDGREYVVCRGDAVKIRAEDGRRVEKVNISPFISNLPFGQDTTAFSTDNASGSTSQAANIIEALECGTSLLLIDEDTSATNFMIRDGRMQELIPKEKEPITPFIDQVRNLYREYGVSTILVMGGCSDYFEVADTVIAMDSYLPKLLTQKAHELAGKRPMYRRNESGGTFGKIIHRIPLPESIDPYRRGKKKTGAKGVETIQFGQEFIELDSVEQLVDPSQTRAIADLLVYALNRGYIDGKARLREILDRLFLDIETKGLDIISPFRGHPGEYAKPRRQELAAALNRLRTLKVKQEI